MSPPKPNLLISSDSESVSSDAHRARTPFKCKFVAGDRPEPCYSVFGGFLGAGIVGCMSKSNLDMCFLGDFWGIKMLCITSTYLNHLLIFHGYICQMMATWNNLRDSSSSGGLGDLEPWLMNWTNSKSFPQTEAFNVEQQVVKEKQFLLSHHAIP